MYKCLLWKEYKRLKPFQTHRATCELLHLSKNSNQDVSHLTKMDRVSQYLNVHKEALELFKKKNKDYGNAFATFGPIGVIVRMGDKINRLVSVSNNGIRH